MTAPRDMVSADLVNRLRAMVAGKLRDRAEIDDVVQEVLIKIVRDGDAVSPDRFWGWLKQVIYTTVNDVYRARSARRSSPTTPAELEAFADEALTEVGGPDEHPLSCCLPAFLNQLPDDERELLRAVDIDGIAQRELAAAPEAVLLDAQVESPEGSREPQARDHRVLRPRVRGPASRSGCRPPRRRMRRRRRSLLLGPA